jgi:hypothetical protein
MKSTKDKRLEVFGNIIGEGFKPEDLKKYGEKLTQTLNQRTKVLCPKCKTPLFYWKGDLNFIEKTVEVRDLEPIGNQTLPNSQNPSGYHCHECDTIWIIKNKYANVYVNQILTEKGWIPKV